MQKILITGANGQLGNEMRVLANNIPDFQFLFTDIQELDICNENAVHTFMAENRPAYIVNCAAYTAVDKAEDDIALCNKINVEAVRILGKAAAMYQARIIHVSTDYVFDGTSCIPYTEEMPVCPASVYGKSKLDGELALKEVCDDAVIVRTSWLYSSYGNNFVKTMIRLGEERDSLKVIFDQIGTPTYAADLAYAIMQIVKGDKMIPGVFHFSNEGVTSWYDFTLAIHKIAGINCEVRPIESKEYPVRTPRPHYSVLNKSKIKLVYGIDIPHWLDSLEKCIQLLKFPV